jgi:cellulose biosynthesis protein BcsQ
MKIKTLNIISGKGGSGKTIIALSMTKILSELGFKVLLIDCDVATHGATYFYENELEDEKKSIKSLHSICNKSSQKEEILRVEKLFDFIPSTTDTSDTKIEDITNLEKFHKSTKEDYDIIILDTQAGYSDLNKLCVKIADKNLIVLEADSISSAAIRVLYLQIGNILTNKNTWQLFNKLADEERKIYSKVVGGTLFPNLSPIPFDWNVRATFALGNVPSIKNKDSAFGLAILRITKIIFKQFEKKIEEYENETIGNWFTEILQSLNELEEKKKELSRNAIEKRNKENRNRYLAISSIISVVSALILFSQLNFVKNNISFDFNFEIILGAIGLATGVFLSYFSNLKSKRDKEIEFNRDKIANVDFEIQKYRTLIETDSKFKEFYNENLEKTTHNILYK